MAWLGGYVRQRFEALCRTYCSRLNGGMRAFVPRNNEYRSRSRPTAAVCMPAKRLYRDTIKEIFRPPSVCGVAGWLQDLLVEARGL